MSKLPSELEIRRMRLPHEAVIAAEMMASSDPWQTLRRDRDACLKALLDPTREVYAAATSETLLGVLSLHLAGLLNGYIAAVAVHPDWRCSGLGTRLVVFAEERIFRQSPNVFLCVSSFNEHAQRLYVRLGYERVGELRDYVVRGHSEILMRKTKGPWQP
jgi:[ribosomal protein S18]-alanine N-acetyltransferase